MTSAPAYVLSAENIVKDYGANRVLNGVSVGFERGKVHALLGKNGAGKSTLIKILSGVVAPGGGSVRIDGREVRLDSPRAASAEGIATVYQELGIIPEFSVAENILMGRMPVRRFMGAAVIQWDEVYARAAQILDELHVKLDVKRPARELSVAQQQIVEIARVMTFDPKVVIFDEPTAALAQHEVDQLFVLIRKLTARGCAIVYISHRMQELKEIADSITVLRDGKVSGTLTRAEYSPVRIAEMMFGQAVTTTLRSARPPVDEPVLRVRDLNVAHKLHDIGFTLYRGEILGLAGVIGSGRTELLTALFGAMKAEIGELEISGQRVEPTGIRGMVARGLGLVPEDRKRQGLVLSSSTQHNIGMSSLRRFAHNGVISERADRELAQKTVADLHIAVRNIDQLAGTLSGGNQQKVVFGKWLNNKPSILLLDEPTRGVDIQSKQQIYELIRGLRERGISCIFVSSELDELLEVCDRILVLRHGQIVAERRPQELSVEQLFALCIEN